MPSSIQVNFRQQDIAKDSVILHLVGVGVHGIGIFIAGDASEVSSVGFIGIAAAKRDGNNALAGVDERTAAVGCSDVGVIIGVPQPNRLGVQ